MLMLLMVDIVKPNGMSNEECIKSWNSLAQLDSIDQVIDALEVLGARAPDHADDLVALLEQQLSQV